MVVLCVLSIASVHSQCKSKKSSLFIYHHNNLKRILHQSDYALRNGFVSLASILRDKIKSEDGLKITENNNPHSLDKKCHKASQKEMERYRLQLAFNNLSLKDKMILNMMMKQQLQTKTVKGKKSDQGLAGDTIVEGSISSDSEKSEFCRNQVAADSKVFKLPISSGEVSINEQDNNSDDDISVVISHTDRESLDIAMRLMNDEVMNVTSWSLSIVPHFIAHNFYPYVLHLQELEELQDKSTNFHKDLKEWMLKRNYESLKEASDYLHKTLQKHKEEADEIIAQSPSSVHNSAKEYSLNQARRSLKNVQNKALAALVLRKNITSLGVKPSTLMGESENDVEELEEIE